MPNIKRSTISISSTASSYSHCLAIWRSRFKNECADSSGLYRHCSSSCNVGFDGPFLIVPERECITYLLFFAVSPQKKISKFDIVINVSHRTIKMKPNLLYKSIHSFRKVRIRPVYRWWRYLKGICHCNSVISLLFFFFCLKLERKFSYLHWRVNTWYCFF